MSVHSFDFFIFFNRVNLISNLAVVIGQHFIASFYWHNNISFSDLLKFSLQFLLIRGFCSKWFGAAIADQNNTCNQMMVVVNMPLNKV